MTIQEIGTKIDKIVITAKDFKKISKWTESIKITKILDNRYFFPLNNFVIDISPTKNYTIKALVELDNFNPTSGKITTDDYWFTFKHLKGEGRSKIDGFGATKQVLECTHIWIVGALLYIVLQSREKKVGLSSNTERPESDKSNPYKYQNRVCFLLDEMIEYVSLHPTRKSIQYQCECWGVRGHLRHYTDGRVVFIEPYKKGRLRDTLEPKSKTYMLTRDLGDYPDAISNQFDNMTGSMNL